MHLLATREATLDETETAIDLGQSPAEIVLLSFSDSDLSASAAAWQGRGAELPSLRLASLKALKHPMSVDLYIERVVAQARAVIVRCLGGLDYWRYGLERLADVAREKGLLFVALPGDDRPDPRLARLCTVPAGTAALVDRYFREGGSANVGNALAFAAHLLDGRSAPPGPVSMGAAVGMSGTGAPVALETLFLRGDGRPAALVVFYRASLLAADTEAITALMAALDGHGLAPVALAVTRLKDPDAAGTILSVIAARSPAVIVNATAFSALREDDTTVLDAAGVPVLQVALAGASQQAWEASPRGLGPSDIAMNVVLPELDGRLFTRAISFKSEAEADAQLEYAPVRHAPHPGRIDFVARLAAAWVRLGATPRRERRVALMLSDYPQRGGRKGYAVGLDSPASVAEILNLLAGEGFDAGSGHWSSDDIGPLLAGQGPTLDVPLALYRRWFARLPDAVQSTLTQAWGEPEADPSLVDGAFRFPCLAAGKVTVLVQPDRGSTAERKQGYHDTSVPPRHAYVALYAWLREAHGIDALIHLGTHGTLEWLPGKALALSEACCPEAVLGPVPVVYPFIVNNPGEAVQAKRRLSAVTIGYLTPPLSQAGLSGGLSDLECLIEEFAEAEPVDRRRAALIEKEILERARGSGLAAECGVADTDTARAAIIKLDAQLCDIKELMIRDRFHVFGREPEAAAAAALAAAIRASSGGGLAAGAIEELIADCAAQERAALVAALDGRRVAPGPAGAPTRGRADVLPTGRNLTTIDPRAIPTRTAAAIGARAAEEVVRRYLQDHGEHPRSLVLDLWASASLRTGGDDLAQALAYLGVRPVWDAGSNRVTGVEVMPAAKLDRPRIDVTLRVSGLFRDIFAAQIALVEMAVDLVAGLDEDEAWNPLAAAHRRGERLLRVFGGAPGTYGAGAADLALDGAWATRDDLGRAYLAATTHAFGARETMEQAGAAFRARIAAADALVHPQDDRERDILDGDGTADFAGGFASAAAALGREPALYHLDTSRTDAPRVRAFAEEIARVVRGRLANPRWLASMARAGHRGVAEIAQGVDALFSFAATTPAVPSHLFDAVHEAVFQNEALADDLHAANPAALEAIARRLEDAIARRLWVPRRNAVHAELSRVRGGPGDGGGQPVEAAP